MINFKKIISTTPLTVIAPVSGSTETCDPTRDSPFVRSLGGEMLSHTRAVWSQENISPFELDIATDLVILCLILKSYLTDFLLNLKVYKFNRLI